MPPYLQLWLFALLCAATVYASPLVPRDETINFGTIGDSWASGVTYGLLGYTDYDDNTSGCMRINHAYGVQLKDDWPFGATPPDFIFAACSGARLFDMFEGSHQMNQLPTNTHFVTMQAGGNDAGFYNLARDCIFHNEDKDYGGSYPDPTGECYKAIDSSRQFIQADSGDEGIWRYMDDTIRDIIFDHPSAKRDDFKLYVLGYAHLWNVDSPDSDWCNEESFSVSLSEFINDNRVKLSNALRFEINDLTSELNDQIQDVIRNLNSPKVVYVSVTDSFQGHRFCEKGHTRWDQYFGTNVWFHNASPDGLFKPYEVDDGYGTQETADNDWNQAYNVTHAYIPNLEAFNWVDLLQMEKGFHATSPHQGWSAGVALRPLHPKKDGHGAIKDVLKPLVLHDFMIAGTYHV